MSQDNKLFRHCFFARILIHVAHGCLASASSKSFVVSVYIYLDGLGGDLVSNCLSHKLEDLMLSPRTHLKHKDRQIFRKILDSH